MLTIPCPHCGPRDEAEFVCGGQSHLARPDLASADQDWAPYLFIRDNPKGMHHERWRHAAGCGLWFNLARDTATHEIVGAYDIAAHPPECRR